MKSQVASTHRKMPNRAKKRTTEQTWKGDEVKNHPHGPSVGPTEPHLVYLHVRKHT